jgi:hypothetical protein
MRTSDVAWVFLTTAEIRGFLDERRSEAATLRRNYDERGAALIERVLGEIDSFLQVKAEEPIAVGDAATATGFSADHLRRQVSSGELKNLGVPNKPAVRRGDLRPKRKKTLASEKTDSYDVGADVLALRIRRGE